MAVINSGLREILPNGHQMQIGLPVHMPVNLWLLAFIKIYMQVQR